MNEEPSEKRRTKVVGFKDAVYFRVLDHWVVGSEDDDLLVIYEDRPGSGTLRVWTETYAFDDSAARDAAVNAVHATPSEPLNERTSLSYTLLDGEEDSEALRLHQWIAMIRTGKQQLRVVTFTHTVDAATEQSDETVWELQAVELAVRSAFYQDDDPETGI
jgi:hypothetical protein